MVIEIVAVAGMAAFFVMAIAVAMWSDRWTPEETKSSRDRQLADRDRCFVEDCHNPRAKEYWGEQISCFCVRHGEIVEPYPHSGTEQRIRFIEDVDSREMW